MKKRSSQFKNIVSFGIKFLGSPSFLWVVLGLLFIQAVWIAASFRFPMLYDEAFHFGATTVFSTQISPIITDQPTYYDQQGSFAYGGATLFHYLLSFPLRFIALFTDNLAVQVIILRLINTLLVVAGLVVYWAMLQRVGIRTLYVNIALFFFVLLPIVPFVAATINYDNLLFLITGLFFYLFVLFLQQKKLNINVVIALVALGIAGVLVKTTFIPIFLASAVVFLVVLFKRYGRKTGVALVDSVQGAQKLKLIILSVGLLTAVLLSGFIYGGNIVKFRSIMPSCEKTLTSERCEANFGALRNNSARGTRETRVPMQLPEYISMWTIHMVNWSAMSGGRTAADGVMVAPPMPLFYNALFVALFASITVITIVWKMIWKNRSLRYLLFISGVTAASIFLQNYLTYIDLRMPYGMQPRYLLTILPIVMAVTILAIAYVVKKQAHKVLLFMITLIICTQGAGLITHIMRSDHTWYWENDTVYQVNDKARSLLKPFVQEWWYEKS